MAITGIATNISAYYAQRNLKSAGINAELSVGRLSSGNKIVKASDDVASLSIGTSLSTQVNTLKTALLNASQAISLLEVADGGLTNITSILKRQKQLSVQANSGTLTGAERGFLNQEFQNLVAEIDRIVAQTNFNGIVLLDGTAGATEAGFDLTDPAAAANYVEIGTFTNSLAVDSTSFAVAAAPSDGGLIGGFGDFSGIFNFDAGGNNILQVTINGVTYTSVPVGTTVAAGTTLTFNASNGGQFTFDTGTSDLNLTTQTDVDAVAQAFTEAFSGVQIYQQRAVTNFVAPPATSNLNGLVTGDVFVQSNDIDTVGDALGNISEFTVRSVSGDGANDATISVTINGAVYTLDNTTVTYTASNQIDVSASTAARFVSATDSNDYIQVDFSNVAADIDILTAEDATALKESLDAAFGVTTNNSATGGLEFQVGVVTTDTIAVSLGDSSTTILYGGSSLNVLTVASAQDASDQLDLAIDTLTSLRADVGALMSRFEFASDVLETSIQNQDAARSVLLDTDIADESTAFAQSQVLLQASISVLAQANLLPQNLLKLIG